MNKYKDTFTCEWCCRRFKTKVQRTNCSQFPCKSRYELNLEHIRQQVSFSRYRMERFCNICGAHIGFFTEKKWNKMHGICSRCYLSGKRVDSNVREESDVISKYEVTPPSNMEDELENF